MERRRFIQIAALTGGTSLAAPAIAQTAPPVRWRCLSGFPTTLDTLFGAAQMLADAVAEATGGRFEITVEEAGLPALEQLDALSAGSVEMLHTAPHYFSERDTAFAFGSGLPFGLNQRLTNAWLLEGGGLDIFNAYLGGRSIVAFPAGNTGAQMGGWFNREINALADLAGIRFRIGGFGRRIIQDIGVIPQDTPPEGLVAAFEANEIDAAEFAGPAEDTVLGLPRVARYLYYPGWWEGGVALMAMINLDAFNALPAEYQVALRHASAVVNTRIMARYDVLNPPALAALENAGTIVRPYSNDIMDACFSAAEQAYRTFSRENEAFAELWESYSAYRRTAYSWMRRSDYAFDTYMMILDRGGRL
jgi:TRAP-type mannitol/chloroaromatic compound transport system substrate-binding protein